LRVGKENFSLKKTLSQQEIVLSEKMSRPVLMTRYSCESIHWSAYNSIKTPKILLCLNQLSRFPKLKIFLTILSDKQGKKKKKKKNFLVYARPYFLKK
jgi:hypothetical protein